MRSSTSVLGLLAMVAACSTETPPGFDGKIPLGMWGGDSAGMIVSDTAMHLHIACSFGDVSGRVPVDENGNFDVTGSYTLQAYPIAVGPSLPARFVGRLDGNELTAKVTVTVDDTVGHQTVVRGPVQVTLGDDPRLGPCPICRRPIVTRKRHVIFKW